MKKDDIRDKFIERIELKIPTENQKILESLESTYQWLEELGTSEDLDKDANGRISKERILCYNLMKVVTRLERLISGAIDIHGKGMVPLTIYKTAINEIKKTLKKETV